MPEEAQTAIANELLASAESTAASVDPKPRGRSFGPNNNANPSGRRGKPKPPLPTRPEGEPAVVDVLRDMRYVYSNPPCAGETEGETIQRQARNANPKAFADLLGRLELENAAVEKLRQRYKLLDELTDDLQAQLKRKDDEIKKLRQPMEETDVGSENAKKLIGVVLNRCWKAAQAQ